MIGTLVMVAGLGLASQAGGGEKPKGDDYRPDPAWKKLGEAVWFDAKGRRVIVRARVALTDGALEHLLCREETKEHESILASAAPPRTIHAALILAGAEVGHPVRFRPKYEPPAGTPIAIDLTWTEGGKDRHANARDWVKDPRTSKTLDIDWVFAGSDLFEDPETKKVLYAADGGDVITVANFPSAMLDLPIASSDQDDARSYVANTPKIPPRGTPVTMVLRPIKPAAEPKPAARP